MISLKTSDWQIGNIETVLFDKDGTFIDLHYFWGKMTEMRAETIIKKFALQPEAFEKICLFLGYNPTSGKMLSDGITALYSRSKIIEIFRENLQEFGIKSNIKELEEIFDSVSNEFYKNIIEYTKPIDEAIKFIQILHQKGLKLGIVTSDSVISTELTLNHFGWEKYFDVVMLLNRDNSKIYKKYKTQCVVAPYAANPYYFKDLL